MPAGRLSEAISAPVAEGGGSWGNHGVPPRLKENLEGEVDRATSPKEPDRFVQVYVVARRQDESALGVIPCSLELLVTPLLDAISLGYVHQLEFCRRHSDALPQWGIGVPRLFVHYDVSVVPFLGGLHWGFVNVR